MTVLRVTAIVLAAGRSSRMAPRNKLLAPLEGEPIVARVAGTAIESGADPVIVVTGFEAERVAQALRGLNITLVHNSNFEEGLSTSLRAGLEALPANIDDALILLGDMPFVEARDLKALMRSFAAKDRRTICVPVRHCERGNPVLWGAAHFTEIMAMSGDVGAKQLLEQYQQRVIEVPVESDGVFTDIDTPADLARFTSTNKLSH
jgi:molybdenum cofactor cytidylyltransferase